MAYEKKEKIVIVHGEHKDDVWLLGTSVKDMGRSLCTIIKVGFTPETVMTMDKIGFTVKG